MLNEARYAWRSSGNGDVNSVRAPVDRVCEAELEGVQEEPARTQALVRDAVAGIPHDRVADGRHVHADLMGPPALERELEQGRRAAPRPAVPAPCSPVRAGFPEAVTAIFVGVRAERPIGASTSPRSSATSPATRAR